MFNHHQIEEKWRSAWEQSGQNTAHRSPQKPKKYVLDMFPYPSGSGLHVGHTSGYTATDILSRYYRMKGNDVLHPMGWDAFGLPAENYAIKTGIHPRPNTNEAIATFTEQMKKVGLSYDWSREIATHKPDYYKWTQWMFQLLYKRGLAYKKEAMVNWDPIDQTVLANEQVLPDGTAERSGAKVVQKKLNQWFFKITDYAERLLNDLDNLDWPESTKLGQKNWIGKSVGAEVDFAICAPESAQKSNAESITESTQNKNLDQNPTQKITVFTTRIDTLFSGTFLILAPEHELVAQITTDSQKSEVEKYLEKTAGRTELERTGTEQNKDGVWTGSYAINPANGEKMPIWISDFVLVNYGTGAVFADSHDERDFEIAKKLNIPLKTSIKPVSSSDLPVGYQSLLEYQTAVENLQTCFSGYGELYNSAQFDGLLSQEAQPKIIAWLEEKGSAKAKTTYKLRDWLVSRQRYWGAPIPVTYSQNQAHLYPENLLPVLLPDDVEFHPTGRSPLLDHTGFHQQAKDIFGADAIMESDTMDTFVCSSWYFFRFCDPTNPNQFASPESLKTWAPVDIYVGGAEHTVLHLLYARFFTKVLFDAGYINFNEPFLKLRHQGLILAEDGRKMSKRFGNVINPTEVVEEFGADTLRMYHMFMGPFNQSKPWSVSTVKGVRRFLEKVWKLQSLVSKSTTNQTVESALHFLIKKVEEDTVDFKFNTAVSQFMKFVNTVNEEKSLTQNQWLLFLQTLSPYAPFIAEELWHLAGQNQSIHLQDYPSYNPNLLVENTVTIGVQINGKVRGQVQLSTTASEEEAREKSTTVDSVIKHIEGKTIRKFIYIPGKIINIVVG